MADEEDVLSSLSELVRSLDDGTLEAIASAGLLRRARKDMESGRVQPSLSEVNVDGVVICVDDNLVSIPKEGPGKARCDCPSTGTCRHILTSILYLRQREEGTAEADSIEKGEEGNAIDDITALPLDDITRWAGKRSMRKALHVMEMEIQVEASEESMKAYYPIWT